MRYWDLMGFVLAARYTLFGTELKSHTRPSRLSGVHFQTPALVIVLSKHAFAMHVWTKSEVTSRQQAITGAANSPNVGGLRSPLSNKMTPAMIIPNEATVKAKHGQKLHQLRLCTTSMEVRMPTDLKVLKKRCATRRVETIRLAQAVKMCFEA